MTIASLAALAPSAMTCDTAMLRMMTLRALAISSSMPCRCAPAPVPSSVLFDAILTLSVPWMRPENVTTYGSGLAR